MTKRVVSKRTKLLFIGFGAAAIAAACIVATTTDNTASAKAARLNTKTVSSS